MKIINILGLEFNERNILSSIRCSNETDVETLYNLIKTESDFMLRYDSEGKHNSLLVIGNNLTAKLINGDLTISSSEKSK